MTSAKDLQQNVEWLFTRRTLARCANRLRLDAIDIEHVIVVQQLRVQLRVCVLRAKVSIMELVTFSMDARRSAWYRDSLVEGSACQRQTSCACFGRTMDHRRSGGP